MVDDPTDVLPAGEVEHRATIAAAPPATPTALIGRTLGRFTLTDKLGRGGSGDVFRAEQVGLSRTVVVKVLRRELAATVNRVERFLREAQLASRLDHPYAAHVYAFGAEPDGVLWIAMEHVRGGTLDELVARRGPMPAAVFAPLFGRLCEVVHTAHELGIVHRDIKGSNVMVIERAGQLLPKLLDFGIAKLGVADLDPEGDTNDRTAELDDAIDAAGDLTAVGATLGSPQYMAPEQWSNAADVDARADIYALGALAYRCVAGELPFRGTDRRALAEAHTSRPPPPLPGTMPAALSDAILRALAKQPADRWTTALAFGEAVRFAVGVAAPEAVPLFDPYTRDVWLRAGPQPIADAVERLAGTATTVECDAALRDLVAITCRWLAVLALSTGKTRAEHTAAAAAGPRPSGPSVDLRARARGVVGSDDALPWLELARAASLDTGSSELPGLTAALAGSAMLATLAGRLDSRDRTRTAQTLAADIADATDALRPIEPLLAYQLVVGRGADGAERWTGPRRSQREPAMVWDEALGDGEVALLDAAGKVVARLSPLAQVIAPLPSAEPEMFVLWRSARGSARLVAAPWGFERDDDRAGELIAMLSTEDGDTAHDAAEDAPYPGLSPYGVGDADRFVGREREIEALANRLIRAPLLAVLGPSGAGKSSFVHAGVVPRLEANGYRVVTMRPGRHPMHALAALLSKAPAPPGRAASPDGDAEVGSVSASIGRPGQDGASTAVRLRELGESAVRGLVIVIDQLEELVTLCGDPAERTRFAETLAAAADGTRAPVRVVVTLRDDFAAVIESEPALRGRFEVFVLGTPLPEALRRIVVEPARRAGVAVAAAVVDDMVAEVAGRPASLPLLSFTAAELWRTREPQSRQITRDAYLAIGGVAGALSTYADQIYDALARKDQQVVRAVFARLVAGDGTRIPMPRKELEQLPDTTAVLAHLIDARLLVVREDENGAQDNDVVEVIHECLAERWDRLARWRREDAVDGALVADLRAAARRWLDTGRSADMLWRGEALAEARRLLATGKTLTDAERDFATASDAANRRARRLRRGAVAAAMAALAAVAVVMAYLGVAANRAADAARTSATLADDRLTASLVAQGRRELNDSHELSALAYFAEALRRGADSPALRLMIAVADRGRGLERHVYTHRTFGLIGMDDEFVGGGGDDAIHVYAPSGEERARIPVHLDAAYSLRAAPDHRVVGVGPHGNNSAVVVADLASKRVVAEFDMPVRPWHARLGPAAGEIAVMADDGFRVYDFHGTQLRFRASNQTMSTGFPEIDASGRWVIYNEDHRDHVLDLLTMTDTLLPDGWGAPWSSADGSRRGVMDKSGAVHIVSADGTLLHTIPHRFEPGDMVTFDDSGEAGIVGAHTIDLFTRDGSADGSVQVDQEVSGVAMRGHELWVGDLQGTLRHFKDGRLVGSLPSHMTEIMAIALAGDAVASVSSDSTMVVSTADFVHLRIDKPPCENGSYGATGPLLAYSCDDRLVLMLGRRRVGEIPLAVADYATYSRSLERAAVSTVDHVVVFDRDGKVVATSPSGRTGPTAYADADHLYVLTHDASSDAATAVMRWQIGTERWDRVIPAPDARAIVAVGDGFAVGYRDGSLAIYANGSPANASPANASPANASPGATERYRLALGATVAALDISPDGTSLLATTASGDAIVIATATGTISRRLTAGEALGGQALFDDGGHVVLRLVRAAIAVTDLATGADLLFNFDLMRNVMNARGLADGRIELDGDRPMLLDIATDQRSRADIIRGIECRVPLRVDEAALAPAKIPADCP